MSTRIYSHKHTELRTRQTEDMTRIATSLIERRLSHGGQECLIGVGIISSITIDELKERDLKTKWNEVSRLVEEILLKFYSAELWNPEENPTLSKRLYTVRRSE